MNLQSNHKYALFSLPHLHVRGTEEVFGDFGDGYVVSDSLPGDVPHHWREWLGTLSLEEIEAAGIYLVVHAPSSNPEILDDENKALQRKLYQFYAGLTITIPFIAHSRITYLTGAQHASGPDVREHSTYDELFHTLGSPQGVMNKERIRAAKRIGLAITTFSISGRMERLPRILTAFRSALYTAELDFRLHQFVRAIEGFVLPESSNKADDFADRVLTFTTGLERSDARELYSLRSSIEHLNGPFTLLHGTPNQKHLTLLLRTIQAECIARYLLRYFLDTPDMWEDFFTPAKTRKFWRDVISGAREWGGALNLANVTRDFLNDPPHLPSDD